MGADVAPVGRPFLLSDAQLSRSLQHEASPSTVASLWAKLDAGMPLRIGVLGSSVAMSGGCQLEYQAHLRCAQFDGLHVHKRFARGYGVVDDEMKGLLHNADRPVRGFVLQVLDAINSTWPHRGHRVINAAMDAWTAKSIEPCLLSNEQITSSDLLLLELGSQGWHSSQAAASERIVRKLLARAEGPPPVLVMVTTRQWCGRSVHGLRRREKPVLQKGWNGIEDIFARFCEAYDMACLSLRDAIFHDVLAGRENFTVPDVAADCLHPEQSRFGYHYMADMIINFLRRSYQRHRDAHRGDFGFSKSNPVTQYRPRPLPAALLRSNQGSVGRMVWRCFALTSSPTTMLSAPVAARDGHSPGMPLIHWQPETGTSGMVADTSSCDSLRRCVLRSLRTQDDACLRGRGHWQYCSRALAPRAVNKPGIVSVLPGAVMRLMIDTSAPVTRTHANGTTMPVPILALTYLSSYENMGVCLISCESGCSCPIQRVDALQFAQQTAQAGSMTADAPLVRNVSIATVAEISLTAARRCVLRLENVPRDSGAKRSVASKWKLLQVRVGWDLGLGGTGSQL